ncbi:MAG: DUF3014 domain-containing protein [Pseudomonadales bacterium]|nr:DUF3014 domain-containing protein [Pseudomonadales bacterium]
MRTNINYIVTGLIVGGLIVAAIEFWPFSPLLNQTQQAPVDSEQVIPEDHPSAGVAQIRPDEEIGEAGIEVAASSKTDNQIRRPEPAPLPEFDDSDIWLLSEILKLGLVPSVLEGFNTIGLAGRLATQLAALSEGRVVRKGLGGLSPFLVRGQGDEIWLNEEGYRRYDRVLSAFEIIEPTSLARFVSYVEPLLETGLRRLGDKRSISEIIRMASVRVQSAPVIERPIRLVRPNVYYRFADVDLEHMTDLEKQFVRMGPVHTLAVQSYTRDFVEAYFKP